MFVTVLYSTNGFFVLILHVFFFFSSPNEKSMLNAQLREKAYLDLLIVFVA